MGKKSRAKREIRAIRASVQGLYEPEPPSWKAEAAVRQAARDVEFQARVVAVAVFLNVFPGYVYGRKCAIAQVFYPAD